MNNEILETFLANLKHAYRNLETVSIGGGEFSPNELKRIEQEIKKLIQGVDALSRDAYASLSELK